jgi:hypothetical protein
MDTIVTLLLSALIPLIVGFIWYNPKVFGGFWMRVAEMNEEKMKSGKMIWIFLLTYIFGFMLSAIMMSIVIHQTHLFSLFADTPEAQDSTTEAGKLFSDMMTKYGNNFRTFKHGAFHGTLSGIFIALPIIGINALFERRGGKYILVHVGYWTVTLALIGGTICQFAMRS